LDAWKAKRGVCCSQACSHVGRAVALSSVQLSGCNKGHADPPGAPSPSHLLARARCPTRCAAAPAPRRGPSAAAAPCRRRRPESAAPTPAPPPRRPTPRAHAAARCKRAWRRAARPKRETVGRGWLVVCWGRGSRQRLAERLVSIRARNGLWGRLRAGWQRLGCEGRASRAGGSEMAAWQVSGWVERVQAGESEGMFGHSSGYPLNCLIAQR